ncbi:hydantoinase B/oxoprolinase family protein [Patulibacter sp.]|uniref:hydantoinase B/oxoprolinase family protein n=1 Tax=Patulibacter sp. TaxID=1912859 RepID=UPI00272196BB|nr:hydantoinase B/oxoprolinase family protein [Patulibacter sp.]MDO9409007.1 hydantoinase B/oxoprolinase family protein [Patulibacter sp.]
MSTTEATNAADLAIFAGAIEQICSEMDTALERAAFSPIISESVDRASGIYSSIDGGAIAQGHRGLPIFTGCMQYSVEAFLDEVTVPGERDVYMLNDPYRGGTHLMDVRLITPFHVDGELVCVLANTAHWADMGGAVAGGFGSRSTTIHEEGLRFGPTRLVRDGEVDHDVLGLVLDNVRVPEERHGDIVAQLGALEVGRRRLTALVERYGLDGFRSFADQLGHYAERLARAQFLRLKHGRYETVAWLDGDGVSSDPLRVSCAMTVADGRLAFDFAGTSPTCAGPMNSPLGASKSGVLIGIMHAFPGLLINDGTFGLVDITVPPGSFLDARYPSPVAGCASEVPARVIDAVMALLGQALPELAQGAAYSTSANLTVHGHHEGREFIMYFFAGGGYGGHAGGDGLTNACATISMAKVPPIELLEEWYPVSFARYELRPDSAGIGQHRGGLGARYELVIEADRADVSFLMERGRFAPPGIAGGGDGALTTAKVVRTDGTVELPEHVTKDQDIQLRRGDRIVVEMPGGGGFGDPGLRDPALVDRDVRAGYVGVAA